MPLIIAAMREPWSGEIAIYMKDRLFDGENSRRVLPVTFRTITAETDGIAIEPVIRLENTAAQRLMDELWNCGLRPSEGTGSAGALAATQLHLNDMRRLVAHLEKLGEKL